MYFSDKKFVGCVKFIPSLEKLINKKSRHLKVPAKGSGIILRHLRKL